MPKLRRSVGDHAPLGQLWLCQKAPELTQLAHAHVLLQHGVFKDKHMVYGDTTPWSNVWQSVYIEDYCQLSLLDTGLIGPFSVAESSKLSDTALGDMRKSTYDAVKLVRKESKAVTDATTSEIWGIELNVEEKTVGLCGGEQGEASLPRARYCQGVTPSSSSSQSSVTSCGSLVLCLQHEARPSVEGRVKCRLPRRIRDELLLLCAFAWFAITKCQQLPSRVAYASDATVAMGAVLGCELLAREAVCQAVTSVIKKGRSSSRIRSATNPADDPTRDVQHRKAGLKDSEVEMAFADLPKSAPWIWAVCELE
eukprot:6490353-Amphidinium_carterae.4